MCDKPKQFSPVTLFNIFARGMHMDGFGGGCRTVRYGTDGKVAINC